MGKHKSPKNSTSRHHPLPVNRLKKDPGIPRLNLRAKQHDKIAERVPRIDHGMDVENPTTSSLAQGIAGLAATINSGVSESQRDSLSLNSQGVIGHDPTMAAHAHQFKKVLELADVILQVLDARDPMGCRSKIVEDEIARTAGNKKMILILNKTDLVPKENVQAWLRYLRHEYPTIPFKSSTQHQKSHLSSATSKAASKGTPHLLHLLKSIRPAHQSITVGVLGPPNVGKSSLINSIKREKVCTVGAKPGETKALKEVIVERGIRVIDSPGIVWGDSNEDTSTLRNVWSLEAVEDPVTTIDSIVSRVPPETLRSMYSLPEFKDSTEFLVMIALARGKLGKGGTPDIVAAALIVLHDWNIGKIAYFTTPPVVHPSQLAAVSAQSHTDVRDTTNGGGDPAVSLDPYASTSIVSNWGTVFNLEGLWQAADGDVLGDAGVNMEGLDENEGFVPDEDELMDQMGNGTLLQKSSAPSPVERHSISPPLSISPVLRAQRLPSLEQGLKSLRQSDLESAEPAQMSSENPLSRKRLREDAKKRKRKTRTESSFDVDESMGNYET